MALNTCKAPAHKKKDWSESVLKARTLKKVSGLLVTLLMVSVMAPLIAFAGVWYDVKVKDGTVSGSVYMDTYGQNVMVNVYGPDKGYLTTTSATYDKYQTVNGTTYWFYNLVPVKISTATKSVYLYTYGTDVTQDTYYGPIKHVIDDDDDDNHHSGGGGGGYSYVVDGKIDATSGTVSEYALKSEFASNTNVELTIKETVSIPANALVDAVKKDGATLTIVGDYGTYVLPLSVLNLNSLAKAVDVSIADLKINVGIKKLSEDDAKSVADAVAAVDGKQLSEAVDFSLTAEGKDEKKVAITDFDNTYVKRKLPVKTAPSGTSTVVMYNPDTEKLSFVPSTVSSTEAVFKRTGNSVYTVIEASATFNDVKNHWAKADIELLASKLIVEGTAPGTFEADRNINRAEFAALVVRSLGLTVPSVSSNTYFSDVKGTEWYAGVVAAAKSAGLIDGYEDGTFKADKQITREELAAMVVRALKFAGVDTDISSSEQSSLLSKYSDSSKIVWAQEEVAAAIKAGIMDGMTDTTLETKANATRAQSATMLKRLLTKADFID